MAYHGDSKGVDIKGFEADPDGVVRANTRSEEDLSDAIQAKPKRKWQSYIWDTLDKSLEERRLLFKLDAAVLTFATLGYFIKYLDQININNAFVSGMKEDLGLYKNQLNYMQTCWTVGYVIGEVPCKSSSPVCSASRPDISSQHDPDACPPFHLVSSSIGERFCLSQVSLTGLSKTVQAD